MLLSRDNLIALSEMRLGEAKLLIENNRFSGAYYLAGYAIETGLKAAISKRFMAGVIPEKRFVEKIYTHDLEALARLGLAAELEIALEDPDFKANWSVTTQWSEVSRYEMIDPYMATEFLAAISVEPNGIMTWLRQHW